MTMNWKAKMARKLVAQEDPEELVALIDAVFPAVVDVLSSEQLRAFTHHFFREHLTTMLAAMTPADRVSLLGELRAVLADTYPLPDDAHEDLGP
jgi:hypothetical protein